VAGRVASVPLDLTAHNKRVARRMIDSTGVRDGLRWAADLQPLAFHSKSSKEYTRSLHSEEWPRDRRPAEVTSTPALGWCG